MKHERESRMVTIFLDFDGVLTPLPPRIRGEFDWFARLPVFEKAIRPWLDHVEIVVSSTWRLTVPLEKIKASFSPDVARRIKSVTGPDLGDRCDEIERWAKEHGCETWLAIDDHAAPFVNCSERLIAVDRTVGFSEADAAVLAEKLQACLLAHP